MRQFNATCVGTALSICFALHLMTDACGSAEDHPTNNIASPTGPVAASTSLDEVIVTANRCSKNLQVVPTTVTALGAAALLASSVVTDTADLSQVVPGLKFQVATGSQSLRIVYGPPAFGRAKAGGEFGHVVPSEDAAHVGGRRQSKFT